MWTGPWRAFVENLLQPFVAENAIQYPQHTVGQLHDLRDGLQATTDISEHHDIDDEKSNCTSSTTTQSLTYVPHSMTLGNGGTSLGVTLDSKCVLVERRTTDTLVRLDRVETPERWIFRDTGGDWQHIVRYG